MEFFNDVEGLSEERIVAQYDVTKVAEFHFIAYRVLLLLWMTILLSDGFVSSSIVLLLYYKEH
jgi:hypothetical protein